MDTLIYIHGWGSSGDGETATKFKTMFKEDFDVVCPTITNDPEVNIKKIKLIVETVLTEKKEVIVAGSSWGGFFALLVSKMYGLKCFLINPSLRPTENLKKYEGALDKTYDAYKKAECALWNVYPHKENNQVCFLIGKNDDVVDASKNGLLYSKQVGHKLIMVEEDHRIKSEETFDLIKKEILRLHNTEIQ